MNQYVALWKKDFWLSYKHILVYILITFIISIMQPSIYFYFLFTSLVVDGIFFEERKNDVGKFVKSLPVSYRDIVRSRYIFLGALLTFLLIITWIFNAFFHHSYKTNVVKAVYLYQLDDILVALAIMLTVYGFFLPLFHYMTSKLSVRILMGVGTAVFLFIIFMSVQYVEQQYDFVLPEQMGEGTMEWLYKFVPISPYLFLIIAVFLYVVSMFLSEQILKRRV